MTSYPTEPLSGDERVPIGIIGGSGLYDIDGLDAVALGFPRAASKDDIERTIEALAPMAE